MKPVDYGIKIPLKNLCCMKVLTTKFLNCQYWQPMNAIETKNIVLICFLCVHSYDIVYTVI